MHSLPGLNMREVVFVDDKNEFAKML